MTQAGYLPIHYALCNPLCHIEVLRALISALPLSVSLKFSARRLYVMERSFMLQFPHRFTSPPPTVADKRYFLSEDRPTNESDSSLRNPRLVYGLQTQADSPWLAFHGVAHSKHDVDAVKNELPIAVAVRHLHYRAIAVLLEAGADGHEEHFPLTDHSGRHHINYDTPFSNACERGDLGLALQLLQMDVFPTFSFENVRCR